MSVLWSILHSKKFKNILKTNKMAKHIVSWLQLFIKQINCYGMSASLLELQTYSEENWLNLQIQLRGKWKMKLVKNKEREKKHE